MATQLDGFNAVITFLLGLITQVIAVLIANPILMVGVAVGLIGSAIAIFKKIKG